MYDVVIIGAGVVGSAIARELARYNGRVCVIDKEEDVCSGTSKANSAIVHAGFDAQKLACAKRLLEELSGKYQIIYFTCHESRGME